MTNVVPPVVTFMTRPALGPGYQGRMRMYAVEWTLSPASNAWSAVSGFDRLEGAGQTVTHTNDPAEPVRMYRVRTWMENRP